MAKIISDDEIQLRKRARRRLVGAIALVILAAVLLPMVLDREPKPMRQDINIEIPQPDASGFTSTIVPVTEPASDSAAANVGENLTSAMANPLQGKPTAGSTAKMDAQLAPARETSQPHHENTTRLNESKPVPKLQKPEAENNTTKPQQASVESKAAVKLEPQSTQAETVGFVVQLGAFSSATNAKQLAQKLTANGIKAYVEPLKTAQGTKTRVRAGPFATREAAQKARDKLKTIGLNGVVAEKK